MTTEIGGLFISSFRIRSGGSLAAWGVEERRHCWGVAEHLSRLLGEDHGGAQRRRVHGRAAHDGKEVWMDGDKGLGSPWMRCYAGKKTKRFLFTLTSTNQTWSVLSLGSGGPAPLQCRSAELSTPGSAAHVSSDGSGWQTLEHRELLDMDTQVIDDMFRFANPGCVLLMVLCFQQCGRKEDAGVVELRGSTVEQASLAWCGRRCGCPLKQVVAALWTVAMAAAAHNKNEISLLDVVAAILMEIQALDSMMQLHACLKLIIALDGKMTISQWPCNQIVKKQGTEKKKSAATGSKLPHAWC
ncbi:hypothetical protein EJB05_45091, partial [Eragrostis curvula]